MPTIARVVALQLTGEPPPDLGLPPLRTLSSSVQRILAGLKPFLAADAEVISGEFDELAAAAPPVGLTVFYVVGHAWLDKGRYRVAVRRQGGTDILTGEQLLAALGRLVPADARAACFVDTCAAAALLADLPATLGDRCTFIFASAATEEALEFPLDCATRFALALGDALASIKAIDVVSLALDLEQRLSRASLMAPQTVSYWSAGSPLRLEAAGLGGRRPSAWRTYRLLRIALITSGVVVTMMTLVAADYYYRHERVLLALGDLHTLVSSLRVEIFRFDPAANERQPITAYTPGTSSLLRFHIPADDVLITVDGKYPDGQRRVLNFHLNHQPSWWPDDKTVTLRLPPAAEVRRHPGMAYVSAESWMRGPEVTATAGPRPFWIDVAPVTVETYLPLARRFADTGVVSASVLLHDLQSTRGVEATGTTQLTDLTANLDAIFSVLDAAHRPVAGEEAYQDVAAMLPRLRIACATCPAPMTLEEARAYCRTRGMRLPTGDEWELAARGTDGRRFPWGEAWDDKLGNAGLPTETGNPRRPQPTGDGPSPFGVLDMVGNVGDWIEPEGDYSRMFAGGSYRFNADDCTVFARTPDTGDMLPLYEITSRCVDS